MKDKAIDASLLAEPVSEFRHLERVVDQALSHVRVDRPSHDFTSEQIEHAGDKYPTFFGPQIRDVRQPHLVGCAGVGLREVLPQQVRRNLGAIGSVCAESVVTLYFRPALALSPSARMSTCTRRSCQLRVSVRFIPS